MEGRWVSFERHEYGKLRSRLTIPSEKLRGVVDHVSYCGWHECNERYVIRRENRARPPSDYLLLMTVSGQGTASVGEEKFSLTSGTVLILPRGVCHCYGVPKGGRWEFYWMHVSGQNCSAMLEYIIREYGKLLTPGCMDGLAACMERLMHSEMRYCEYELFAAKTLMEIMSMLIEHADRSMRMDRTQNSIAHRVIECLERNCTRPLTLKEIGEQMYMTPEHIIRIFRKETGMTPHQYLIDLRMRRACVYLEESELSVEEITLAAGYRSASSFIALFRERYGVTPKEYRNQHKKSLSAEGQNEQGGDKA